MSPDRRSVAGEGRRRQSPRGRRRGRATPAGALTGASIPNNRSRRLRSYPYPTTLPLPNHIALTWPSSPHPATSPHSCGSDRPELSQHQAGTSLLEPHLGAAADADFIEFRVRQIGNHEEHRLLLEFDHDIDVRNLALETGDARLMHHGEGVNRATAGNRRELQPLGGAAVARGTRRM